MSLETQTVKKVGSPLVFQDGSREAFIAKGHVIALDGRVALANEGLGLFHYFETVFDQLSRRHRAASRQYPSIIPVAVLEKTNYFLSFPQHASFVTNLHGDKKNIDRFVNSVRSGAHIKDIDPYLIAPPEMLLSSAVCYHAYAEIEGSAIGNSKGLVLTAQGRCYRFEFGRFVPLERQWEFNMKEIIFIGTENSIKSARLALIEEVLNIAKEHQLPAQVKVALDPFFGSAEGKGRMLLQRAKDLKYELVVQMEDRGEPYDLAIASFNLHQDYFGNAFNIKLSDNTPCWTSCIAFGIERWMSAYIGYHGPNPEQWPIRQEMKDGHR